MKPEQLTRGNDILKELQNLESNKNMWESSPGFADVVLKQKQYRDSVNTNFMDYELIRIITLGKINTQIAKLDNEFNNL